MSFSFAKPSDYNFKIGDRVVTIYGEVGRVTEICTCDRCKERGFDELTWEVDGGYRTEYVTDYDAKNDFSNYYQIGEYVFGHKFDRIPVEATILQYEINLKHAKECLAVIEEMEGGEAID